MENNFVNPKHYELEGLENVKSIDVLKSILGEENFCGFCHGNVLKYMFRSNKKNGLEDLKKAKVYLEWLIDEMEKLNKQ